MAKDKDGTEIIVTVPPQGDITGKENNGDDKQPMIPKSRLDEVLEKNRVLEQKQKDRDANDATRQKAEDEKNGNWQKLADDARKEAESAKAELTESHRYNTFLLAATEVGIIDPNLAYKALPEAKEGEKMDELVATLIEEKSYLVAQTKDGVPIIISGGGKPPLKPNQKVILEAAYVEAMKAHNVTGAIAIKRQIANLPAKT